MEENRYGALRRRILSSMILVPAIPFIIVMGVGYIYFMASLQESTLARLVRIVEDHKHMIESFLYERQSDLRFVADSYRYEDLVKQGALRTVFEDLGRKSSAFSDIGLFDQNGLHVAYHGPYELAGKDYKDAVWFKSVMEEGVYVSDVFLGYRGTPHFIIAVAKQTEGKPWVIRATIDTSLFSNVVETVRIGKTGEAYIINTEGRFQTQRRSGGALMDSDPEAEVYGPPHRMVKTFTAEDIGGKAYLYAFTALKDNQWMLVVRQEKSEAFKDLWHVSIIVLLVAVAGGILIVSIAFYTTNRIVNRIRRTDTEKKELGQQLVFAGRLAEIGEMSAGFAHEINNPLQIIRAEGSLIETILDDFQAQGVLKDSEDLAQIKDSLHQVHIQVDRCGEITQGLLKFARQKESSRQPVDLHVFLPEVVGLVKRKAGVEGVSLSVDIPDDLANVQADPAQLQQVIVNLLNNALYAIAEKHGPSGGELALEARPGSNGKVLLSVRDNGSGISKEHMEKIFTPFFTTKPVGKGTGLGLSICYGIISKMGGTMEVSSEQGKGTTFTVVMNAA
ncbi:MAG: two-component sensor histidine kinase [Deltaproteobacteria bacterium]|nr:two-component sensor histidine kinase [Deltaproteobacteria bacterium]